MSDRKEVEVARPVVAYLADLKWDVYQEVERGNRADIVALNGRLIWVVEVKTSLTFDVIAQAKNWLDHAHYVSIAVPSSMIASRGRALAYRVCEQLGIGVLEVTDSSDLLNRVVEKANPKIGRTRLIPRFVEMLRARCVPECKTWSEAGNSKSSYFSPFTNTCEQIRRHIKNNGPSTTAQILENIQHHYRSNSTAKSCLFKWAVNGSIKGVRVDTKARPATWHLTEAA